MKVYSGICRGGPWDGLPLAGPKRVLPMILPDTEYLDPDGDDDEPVKIKVEGEYRHVADQWIFRCWERDG